MSDERNCLNCSSCVLDMSVEDTDSYTCVNSNSPRFDSEVEPGDVCENWRADSLGLREKEEFVLLGGGD